MILLDDIYSDMTLFKPGDRVVYVSDPMILNRMLTVTKEINARFGRTNEKEIDRLKRLLYAEGVVVSCHYAVVNSKTMFLYVVKFDDPIVNDVLVTPMQLFKDTELTPAMKVVPKEDGKAPPINSDDGDVPLKAP
jgi:hypothetical protein